MSLRLAEETLFRKVYQLPPLPSPTAPLEMLIVATLQARVAVVRLVAAREGDWVGGVGRERSGYGEKLRGTAGVGAVVVAILDIAMEYFVFEVVNSTEVALEQERKLAKSLERLPTAVEFARSGDWSVVCGSLTLATAYLELQLKRILSEKRLVGLAELKELGRQVMQLREGFPVSESYCQRAYGIVCHLQIYTLNTTARREERLLSLLHLLTADAGLSSPLLSLDTQIVVLYNCLKNLLGSKVLTALQLEALLQLYQALQVRAVERLEDHLLHLFFVVKGLIFRKGKAMESEAEITLEEGEKIMVEKFSQWGTVNLEETVLGLEEVGRDIVRHRVASLATIIGMRLGLPRFCLNFLELMHDSPFNNQAQTIKLCFQLFQAREFTKLQNCLQVVISAASCKHLRERQVLLSLCCIFTGLYLQNREQALLYAKLNHSEDKRNILREQTLLQQVGFAYYNLAHNEDYLCSRDSFLSHARSNLLASATLNPHNYLVQYCLAKLQAERYQYDAAYKHIMECCRSGRGEWVPFSLLACVYFCQRRVSKAALVIEELIRKYPHAKILYYFRAYLQANRLLLELDHDEELQAARDLGEEVEELCRERLLKGKSLGNLLRYCQEYHQLSLGLCVTEYDESYFAQPQMLSPDLNVETVREGAGYQEGQGEQALLQIVPLLLEVGQLGLVEGLLRNIPASPLKTYYKAVLHESRKQIGLAITEYKSVLMQQPYHTPTLISLALVDPDICDALHYIDIAEKFTREGRLWLAKGMLLSKLGRVAEANELFLREGEQGWLELQPDLLYYY